MCSDIPDFLHFESALSEEDRLMQRLARKCVADHVRPTIRDCYEQHRFPDGLAERMGEMGLLGAILPEEFGGSAASALQYGLICRELERGDSAVRSFCSVQSSLVMLPIWKFGSSEQKQRWLPKLAAGTTIGCFALTEPDFGSNPAGMRCSAKQQAGEIVLEGTKRWITNGDIADVALVWAKNDAGEIGAYLLEKGTKGFSQTRMKHKLSLCASNTGELHFDQCRIPQENQLPRAKGLGTAMQALDSARFGIIWGALGAAEECYCTALAYAGSRTQFSAAIASYQLVQAKLVEMLSEITKAQLLALQIARLRDQQLGNYTQVSLGKMNNVRMALEVARSARDVLGANGISGEYPIMRHMCNLESVLTYEGTEDIHRLILGKAITGINAFD